MQINHWLKTTFQTSTKSWVSLRSKWPLNGLRLQGGAARAERQLDLGQMEERVMLSATPVAAVLTPPLQPGAEAPLVAELSETVAYVAEPVSNEQTIVPQDDWQAVSGQLDELARLVDDAATSDAPRHELLVIDAATEDHAQLITDVLARQSDTLEFEIFVLNSNSDGIGQLSDILMSQTDIDALHIVSHGKDGAVRLGDTWLTTNNIESYSNQITQWNAAFNADADLLLYGCDVASGTTGRSLITTLSALTGTDVAASVDSTGNAALDGNWMLEHHVGDIETANVASDVFRLEWSHLLTVAPVLDLDADNSSGLSGADFAVTWTEDGGAVAISDSDAILSDLDSTNLQSLTVSITNLRDGLQESLTANVAGTSIGAVYNGATATLTLSGNDTLAHYQQVLRTVSYNNTSQQPDTATRVVTVVAHDGTDNSNLGTTTLTVVAVNDAPVLDNSGSPTLWTINENDTNNNGTRGWNIVGDSISDVDNTYEGLAITAVDSSNGIWQYSIDDGSSWHSVGVVSDSSSLLLRTYDRLRFVPDTLNADTATVTYRAWDRTSGTQGDRVNTSVNGGTTAFSTTKDTASITVTAVNDAPVLDNSGTPILTTITEDEVGNSGDQVSTIVAGSISDVDTGSMQGIAVTTLDNSNGTWQFSLNNGSSWTNVGTVNAGSSLLLRSVDRLRFVADTLNADTATITYRAWDQTSGTQGSKVDTSINGGATAFSTVSDTASITTTAVNDAPVLSGGGSPNFTGIVQDDTTNTGDLVSTLIASAAGDLITDVDNGAVEGIAITGIDSTNGTWQFSIDGGSTWTDIGAVSDASARVLSATPTDRLRFVPNLSFFGNATLTFRAWDTSDAVATGTAGVNASLNGGTTAISTASRTANLLVNDAPVLDTSGTPTLPTVTEDEVSNSGELISTILGASVTDVNSGALEGLAVTTANNSNGTWQFSTDAGSSWAAVGTVADNSALLLRSVDRLRFVPDAKNADAATIAYRAWDQATGTYGTKVDASTNGSSTAFSTATETASITTTDVNDAPVLVAGASTHFTAILQDDTTNTGDLVSDLIASAPGNLITDVDNGAIEGLAITGLDSTNGTWQFSIDGGSSWTDIGAVSDASARVLSATATDRIRFVPNASFWGDTTLTFRAWDISDAVATGTAGVDASVNGGTTPFSSASQTATLLVNDAPVLDTSGTPTLTTITEDEVTNVGDLISAILGTSVSDINIGGLEGVAVTATNNSNGTWQFSTDNGSSWTNVGTVADNSALLLRSVDRMRFVPDAKNADTGTFTYRAWDQARGTQGTKVDASINGGTTAFSTATETASITTTDVNDAPVLDNSGSPSLTTITEDNTSNVGDLVSSIVGSSISDVDYTAVEGIAVTATDNSNGTWQFSIDNGSTWTAVAAVADNSALLLRSVDRLRFVPDTLNTDTATISYRAWDQTIGIQGTKVDATNNGGITEFSSASDTASVTATAVNDAPVLDTSGTPTLTTITEDETGNSGDLVSTLVGTSISDVDNGAIEGIAVTTTDNSNGTWQFSTDNGSTWTSVGAVADNSALLLRSVDRLRFVPDAMNADAATITYRAWDQASGTRGTKVDASSTGGTTAFSTASETASITVTAVNDAPVLDNSGSPTLTTITEDETNNSGDLVSAIVSTSISDVDNGAIEGIAVTTLNNSNGTWQFSTDNGSTWTDIGTVADNSALLLRSVDRLRFVPDAKNADSPTITYRGWDQTSGTQGTKVDASTNGGTTAFSTATETASITVTAVNDAPVLDNSGAPTLTAITEDETSNGGDLVSGIVGASISDVDTSALEGIAVTALDNSSGTWQFSTDNGATWAAVGTVADNAALLLRAGDRLRFVPDAMNADTATITYRAWDLTSGSHGNKVDVSTNGGITAFSTATDTASITVTEVNDAPVLDNSGSPTLTTITEDDTSNAGDLVSAIVDTSISDVDNGALEGIAVTALDNSNGTWQFSIDNGSSWAAVGSVSDNSALLLRAIDRLRFVPDTLNADIATITYRAWDQTSGTQGSKVNTGTNGGTTAFSTASDTASITATAVNDAPVLDGAANPYLTDILQDDTTNAGDLVSNLIANAAADLITDVDNGAVEGIAVTGLDATNGTWQFSIDGGSTWSNIGAVTDTSARVLSATATDRIRFVPNASYWGTAALTFRAWDTSDAVATGNAGVDASVNGGTTPFSTVSQTASLLVNDAPVLDNSGTPTLSNITEDEVSNTGDLIATILGTSLSDVNTGALEGIALTATDNSNGTWQYSTDNGSTWTAVGTATDNSALLLRSVDRLRFVPDTLNADTATVTYRGWDQTSGTEGTKVDVSTNGGTTAFSTATDTASVTVTAVNDAPVLDNSGTPTLTTITEDDTSNAGDLISSIVGSSISDVDTGALEGIAVTATNNSNGTWQFSTDNGSTWTAVGTVADNSALLLRSVDRLRFVPDTASADTATVTYRAWDQASGTEGTKADASTNGGTTPFSTTSETASISVTALNDAPVLDNSGTPTLTTITEDDTTSTGDLVSAIVSSSISDADSGALEGIAVTTTDNSNGTWQYSTDNGSTWTAVGAVTDNSALLLRSVDRLRFVPDTLNADTATVTYRAWDQTSGSHGNKVDASTNGGTTAFSAASETASVTVTAVNDAPVLDNSGTPTLTTITEDDTSNSGDLIAAIVGSSISDVDTGALEGIAVTTTDNSNGTWQFSTDNGSTWTAVGAVTDTSALLLRSVDRLRFVPDTLNADSATVTYRAWDQTSGTRGTKVDASTNGGTTAFSTASETASISVTAVNDAPVLDNSGTLTLTTITEDDTSNAGNLVSAIVGSSISDADTGALEGIAVTTTDNSNGTWQFSTDDGSTWTDVGAVTDNSALLLRSIDRLRFVPDTFTADIATVTYRAWDQTSGSQGNKVDVSTNGGITAFSTATDTASITVTAVNDAPILDLDANDSSGQSGPDFSTTFNKRAGTVEIADIDMTVLDVDNAVFSSATITLTNVLDGVLEGLTANTSGTLITSSYDSGSGVLTLSGVDTAANYQQVLRSAQYFNSALAPNPIARQITIIINDGSSNSNVATTDVNLLPLVAPTLDLDADNSSGQSGANYATTFVSTNGPTPIADSDAVLTDADSTTLMSLTATINTLYDGASERLSADTSGTAITASYSSGSGVLTLTGTDTVANYQRVLRSIRYENLLVAATEGNRIITVVVNDGATLDVVATAQITVQRAYVPPTIVEESPEESTPPPTDTQPSEDATTTESTAEATVAEEAAGSTVLPASSARAERSETSESTGNSEVARIAVTPPPVVDAADSSTTHTTSAGTPGKRGSDSTARDATQTATTALAASSVEARLQTHAADVVYYLPRSLDTNFLCERIDAAMESKHIETDFDSVVIGSTTILATAFTAGYTFWVLRGGYLLASLVSSMPAWRMLDPLPILDNFCHEDLNDEQEESLQSMVIK